MKPPPATHPKHTTLECPRCGRRLVCAVPTISAACHHKHPATAMRAVQRP